MSTIQRDSKWSAKTHDVSQLSGKAANDINQYTSRWLGDLSAVIVYDWNALLASCAYFVCRRGFLFRNKRGAMYAGGDGSMQQCIQLYCGYIVDICLDECVNAKSATKCVVSYANIVCIKICINWTIMVCRFMRCFPRATQKAHTPSASPRIGKCSTSSRSSSSGLGAISIDRANAQPRGRCESRVPLSVRSKRMPTRQRTKDDDKLWGYWTDKSNSRYALRAERTFSNYLPTKHRTNASRCLGWEMCDYRIIRIFVTVWGFAIEPR